MFNTVLRTGDPTDQVQKTLRSARWTIRILYLWLAAVAGWLIWKGGFIGLIVIGVLVTIVAIWTSIENALERRRLRALMRSGRFSFPVKNAAPIAGTVDAWLLLRRGLKAIAVDHAQGALWFFRSAKHAYRFELASLRRIEQGTRKTWYGRVINTVRFSDQYAGSSLDFDVREGDIDAFLRVAKANIAA